MMLTAQQTRERSLSVIRNNQKCEASPMEILFPQVHRNIQMRKLLDSIPTNLRADFVLPHPDDFPDILQESSRILALDLVKKRDSVLMSAITLALGTADWSLAEIHPRLSAQRQGQSEVVFLDEKELVRFNEPQLIMGTDQKGKVSYLQSFRVTADAGK